MQVVWRLNLSSTIQSIKSFNSRSRKSSSINSLTRYKKRAASMRITDKFVYISAMLSKHSIQRELYPALLPASDIRSSLNNPKSWTTPSPLEILNTCRDTASTTYCKFSSYLQSKTTHSKPTIRFTDIHDYILAIT